MDRRSKILREKLNHLSDEQWRFTVELALERCRFYPTVVDLLEFASEWGGPVKLALPEDTRSVEEKRAEFQAGFQGVFREELRKRGIDVEALVSQKAMRELSKT